MDEAHDVRRALSHGDQNLAVSRLANLVEHLGRHVQREEAGVFRALRDKGEFLDELSGPRSRAPAVRRDDQRPAWRQLPTSPSWLNGMLDDLGEHVEREDLGIFPVSVVTLGAAGWQTIDSAHAQSPSFLLDAPAPAVVEDR